MEGLIEFDITAPEDSPQVYEFEIFLEMPTSLDFAVVATDVVDRRAGAAFRSCPGSGTRARGPSCCACAVNTGDATPRWPCSPWCS